MLMRWAERPRLSSSLVLLLAGGVCFAASWYCSRWLGGAHARPAAGRRGSESTASQDALLNGSSSHLPHRPGRFFLPALVLGIVLRLEIFHRISHQQQCASPGVESLLCLFLIGYEIFSSRRRWGVPPPEDADDPWRSIFDDIYDWFTGPRVTMVVMSMSACLFSLGTFLSVSQITSSTYVCFDPVESRPRTVVLQVLAVVLDATVIVLLWRVLAWTRTAKMRLRVLSSVLVLSSAADAVLGLGRSVLSGAHSSNIALVPFHGADVLLDSVAFAIFAMSASLWVCATSPITPASVLTFLVGTWRSSLNVFSLGDWINVSRAGSLLPLWLIAFGTHLFTHTHDLRTIVFVNRSVLAFLFMVLLAMATIVAFTTQLETFDERHPINDLVYDAQTKHIRWLLKAGTSQSLAVAARVYEERHSGRVPPPYFAEWYQYASGSLIIDDFKQIDRDLAPFWGPKPADLRKRADAMASYPGMAVMTVKNGEVTRNNTGDAGKDLDLEELVEMVQKFSKYLPDMVLPINLSPRPRILPSWKEAQSRGRADLSFLDDLVAQRRQKDPGQTWDSGQLTRASDLSEMQMDACPATSRVRASPYWKTGQFCSECVESYSQGQLLSYFEGSLDVCGQPDLKYLHGFFLLDAQSRPIRQLVPLFGPSKTDNFRDIMIPLPRSRLEMPDVPWRFARRYDKLFWRGSLGTVNGQALRGSHKVRLLHLINRPHPRDQVTMVLPIPGEESQFRSKKVSAAETSRAMPFSVGLTNYSACAGSNCKLVKQAFGTEADTEEALEYRYVLLTDEDDGPPEQALRTIRSGSVPFMSTIFRTWYTERLEPWLHFVPIDVRYQALHTTLAYFTGIDGSDTALKGRVRDAEWIGRRGQVWAEQALAKKDMEIYLFRLLLEWGRLVDDRRDEMGYRRGPDGEYRSDGWTRVDGD